MLHHAAICEGIAFTVLMEPADNDVAEVLKAHNRTTIFGTMPVGMAIKPVYIVQCRKALLLDDALVPMSVDLSVDLIADELL